MRLGTRRWMWRWVSGNPGRGRVSGRPSVLPVGRPSKREQGKWLQAHTAQIFILSLKSQLVCDGGQATFAEGAQAQGSWKFPNPRGPHSDQTSTILIVSAGVSFVAFNSTISIIINLLSYTSLISGYHSVMGENISVYCTYPCLGPCLV